jgi:hypothetical protein
MRLTHRAQATGAEQAGGHAVSCNEAIHVRAVGPKEPLLVPPIRGAGLCQMQQFRHPPRNKPRQRVACRKASRLEVNAGMRDSSGSSAGQDWGNGSRRRWHSRGGGVCGAIYVPYAPNRCECLWERIADAEG